MARQEPDCGPDPGYRRGPSPGLESDCQEPQSRLLQNPRPGAWTGAHFLWSTSGSVVARSQAFRVGWSGVDLDAWLCSCSIYADSGRLLVGKGGSAHHKMWNMVAKYKDQPGAPPWKYCSFPFGRPAGRGVWSRGFEESCPAPLCRRSRRLRERARYRRRGRNSIAPADERFEVLFGYWSPLAARQAGLAVSMAPAGHCAGGT